jgi:hypothetical protein
MSSTSNIKAQCKWCEKALNTWAIQTNEALCFAQGLYLCMECVYKICTSWLLDHAAKK